MSTPSPKEPTIISLFNFKGGVGKTTRCINLASAIAQLGITVLLVDADQQCNLTSAYVSSQEDDRDAYSEDLGHQSDICPVIDPPITGEPRIESLRPRSDVNMTDHDQPGSAFTKMRGLKDGLPPTCEPIQPLLVGEESSETGRAPIYLLPGHPDVILFEDVLTQAESSQLHRILWNGAFRCLVIECALRVSAQIVLVDCAAGSGKFNCQVVMSSDYILPPSFPDAFSYASTTTLLNSVLPSFYGWRAEQVQHQKSFGILSDQKYFLPDAPPEVLPLLLSKVKKIVSQFGQMTTEGSRWYKQFELLWTTAREGFPLELKPVFFPSAMSVIALCPNINDLASVAVTGVALIDLTQPYLNSLGQLQEMTPTKTWLATISDARVRYISCARWLLWASHRTGVLEVSKRLSLNLHPSNIIGYGLQYGPAGHRYLITIAKPDLDREMQSRYPFANIVVGTIDVVEERLELENWPAEPDDNSVQTN